MLRWVVGGASIFVIGAATHANVVHVGGYRTPGAWVCIGLAFLLAVSFGFAMKIWADGHHLGAAAIVLCMCCGEVYWLLTNADREMADRAAFAAPILKQQKAWEDANRRVLRAVESKRIADAAIITEAAKPGCKSVCANMLSDAQTKADRELNEARAAQESLPLPQPVSSVAAVWHVSQPKWDIFLGALRSVAIAGASLALGFAFHPARARKSNASALVQPSQETLLRAVAQRPMLAEDRSRKTSADGDLEHVAKFLKATLHPDPDATASLKLLHARYVDWCGNQEHDPLPPKVLGSKLRAVVDALGLCCEQSESDLVVKGATIKS